MYTLSIDYDDSKQSTYKAVLLWDSITKETVRFDSGDFLVDWIDALKYVDDESIVCSSSVDHFLMDGKRYVMRMIKEDNGYRFATEDEIDKNRYDFKIMISSRMKSFNALQKYYKRKKSGNQCAAVSKY